MIRPRLSLDFFLSSELYLFRLTSLFRLSSLVHLSPPSPPFDFFLLSVSLFYLPSLFRSSSPFRLTSSSFFILDSRLFAFFLLFESFLSTELSLSFVLLFSFAGLLSFTNRPLKATQSQSATQGHSRPLKATQSQAATQGHSRPLKATMRKIHRCELNVISFCFQQMLKEIIAPFISQVSHFASLYRTECCRRPCNAKKMNATKTIWGLCRCNYQMLNLLRMAVGYCAVQCPFRSCLMVVCIA